MSLMHKRGIEALVGMALAVAIPAVLPAGAEAQGMAETQGANRGAEAAGSMVVRPGDSLWSISEEYLDPNATPRQIASEVGRIYILNRDRIGADPNLILPGQRILLPPVVRATPAENVAASSAKSSPAGRGLKSGTERTASTGEAGSKAGRAPDPVALPEMPTRRITPRVLSVADASSPVESFGRTVHGLLWSVPFATVGLFPQDPLLGRKLLGLGVIVLTLLVCGLMAWKLPLKRNVGGYGTWGITYAGGYPPRARSTHGYRGTPELVPAVAEPELGSFESGAPAVANSAARIVAAQRRRARILRQRACGSRQSPRWITGMHHGGLLCRAQTIPRWTFARSPWLHQDTSPRNEGGNREAFAGTREPASQPEPLVGRRGEGVDPSTKRALLVAKHAVFRECFALILEWRTDLRVAWAESLGEARRVLRNLDVEPDLAVVDIELPDGDGIELIGDICEMWPRVSVLALSASQDLERLARAKRAGANVVLTMAASSAEILEKVRRLENS